jgi:hypothetical protein
MSTYRSNARRLSVAAAAFLLGSAAFAQSALPGLGKAKGGNITESVSPAATVLSRVIYQIQRAAKCQPNVCLATFPTLTAKQRVEMQNISCLVSTDHPGSAPVASALLEHAASGGIFYIPLTLTSSGAGTTTDYFVFQQATSNYIPPGNNLDIEIVINSGTNPAATCQLAGQFVTLK